MKPADMPAIHASMLIIVQGVVFLALALGMLIGYMLAPPPGVPLQSETWGCAADIYVGPTGDNHATHQSEWSYFKWLDGSKHPIPY